MTSEPAANPSDSNAAPSAQPEASPRKGPLPHRDLELVTKDNVLLHCRYYPSQRGQHAVPLVLLHGWTGPLGPGSGRDLDGLAKDLQQAGHAVVVPDLRGHGKSISRQVRGENVPLDREQFRPNDLRDMILDVEAVRSFLVEENNQKRLNLSVLGVVGFEMGSVVALNWTNYDWSVPSFPTLKQGQDVRGFVLVSPEQSFKGVDARTALANDAIRRQLSAMIIFGQAAPNADAGRRLYNTFQRTRRPIAGANADGAERYRDLFLLELDTSLTGTRLLDSAALRVSRRIADFVQQRLVSQQESYPWRDRSR